MLTVFPLTIVLALLLNEIKCKWFKSGVSTMLYLPHFISEQYTMLWAVGKE